MNTTVSRGAGIVLLLLFAACGSSGPTAPTATNQPQALPSSLPRGGGPFPPLTGPSRTFVFDREIDRELWHRVSDYTKASRFILYDNGAFVLQYLAGEELRGGELRGGYTVKDSFINFGWEGWSLLGPWGADGLLQGDSLTIYYNQVMQLTDFEDAVYVLRR
ncbi:MAG TPA: hypothetical protein VNJ02_14970 [Vicinamibacterales bacterium]|nr:hypothetical protein [Vicinamibacterales bacterium]